MMRGKCALPRRAAPAAASGSSGLCFFLSPKPVNLRSMPNTP